MFARRQIFRASFRDSAPFPHRKRAQTTRISSAIVKPEQSHWQADPIRREPCAFVKTAACPGDRFCGSCNRKRARLIQRRKVASPDDCNESSPVTWLLFNLTATYPIHAIDFEFPEQTSARRQ
jgi:hypothetical protein